MSTRSRFGALDEVRKVVGEVAQLVADRRRQQRADPGEDQQDRQVGERRSRAPRGTTRWSCLASGLRISAITPAPTTITSSVPDRAPELPETRAARAEAAPAGSSAAPSPARPARGDRATAGCHCSVLSRRLRPIGGCSGGPVLLGGRVRLDLRLVHLTGRVCAHARRSPDPVCRRRGRQRRPAHAAERCSRGCANARRSTSSSSTVRTPPAATGSPRRSRARCSPPGST